jgi:hypothetical protein
VHAIEHISATSSESTPPPSILYGTQHVAKFNRPTPDEVRIFLAVYRLPSKPIDLVLTFNVPVASQDDDGVVGEAGLLAAKTQFEAAVKSLKIIDFDLFV